MPTSRRQFLAAGAAGLLAGSAAGQQQPRGRLGIVIHSYGIRTRVEPAVADPLRFLEFCRERGADGVQLPIGVRNDDYVRDLRRRAEQHQLYLEGSIRTPRDRSDVERFSAEVRTAHAAGATVLRTVLLGGRRYETFTTAEEFRAFRARSLESLHLAEPVLAQQRMTLAVENHKDFRAPELAQLLRQIDSEHVGATVDLGNNLALLEDATETAQALAPWARACHLKDNAVEEAREGFLLSEVPLGEGNIELRRVVDLLRRARPHLCFSLEMITRNPLRIPCLTDRYWATFGDVPGRELARMLAWVRAHGRGAGALPRSGDRPQAEQLAEEDDNVRRSLLFARAQLGL
jgi:sugar phosphate isomerase/epimerase